MTLFNVFEFRAKFSLTFCRQRKTKTEMLLPSEVERLVFGHLRAASCPEAARTFIDESKSPFLAELRNVDDDFRLRVGGKRLNDFIEDGVELARNVEGAFEDVKCDFGGVNDVVTEAVGNVHRSDGALRKLKCLVQLLKTLLRSPNNSVSR